MLVCFKVVRDLEYITPAELSALRDGRLNMSVFRQVIGAYDEAALETALCLADALHNEKTGVSLHALTVGDCESRFVKDLYSLGFEEVVCLATQQDITWRPEFTAANIAAFIRAGNSYDLILAGKQASPGENALMPKLLARELNLPCLPEVLELNPGAKGIEAVCKTDRGKCFLTLIRPAVCVIGEAVHPYLRAATLREKLAAASKELRVLQAADVLSSMGTGRHLHYIYETPEKHCHFIEGAGLKQKIHILWTQYLRQWVKS